MHDTFEFRKAEDLKQRLPEVARGYLEEAERLIFISMIQEISTDEELLSSRNQERENKFAIPKELPGYGFTPTMS